MKRFIQYLKEKGYTVNGNFAWLQGQVFEICDGTINTAIGSQKSYWLELKNNRKVTRILW